MAERGGTVAEVYSDSAKSGWSLDRDGFNALRQAAERGKFDALMVWKFGHLERNRSDWLRASTRRLCRTRCSREQGFLDKDAYAEKRRRVQQEMDSLRPVDYDDLLEAADLLKKVQT